ncbi:hypothetical protein QP229_11410, partial [Streptococcus agalactiae]|nr:hypothetical protein [Streptococcus agalactiae]
VTPAEVRDALKDIAGNLVEFTEEPEATQFRQTLAMRRAGGKTLTALAVLLLRAFNLHTPTKL